MKLLEYKKANHFMSKKQTTFLFIIEWFSTKEKCGLLFTQKMVCYFIFWWFSSLFSTKRDVVCFLLKNGLLFCFVMFPIIILYKREMFFAFYPKNSLLFYILIDLIMIIYKREMWIVFYPNNGLLFICWKLSLNSFLISKIWYAF